MVRTSVYADMISKATYSKDSSSPINAGWANGTIDSSTVRNSGMIDGMIEPSSFSHPPSAILLAPLLQSSSLLS